MARWASFAALWLTFGLAPAGCAPSALERARIALADDDPDTAAEWLAAVVRDHPEEPGAWLALGRALLAANRPREAREAFERAAALAPRSPRPRILIGHTHELERRYDEAELAYRQACEIAPNRARPARVLGARLLRWGRASEAIAPLTRAAELAPEHVPTWHALALAYFHANESEAALETFARARRFLERDGSSSYARELVVGEAALLVRTGRFEQALARYDEILANEPRFVAAIVGRALVLHELGRCAEAHTALRSAVEMRPGDASLRERLRAYEAGPAAHCAARTP